MVFDPNKQQVNPPTRPLHVPMTHADWTQGFQSGHGCQVPPPGLLPPLILTLTVDTPTLATYEPIPQPPWGTVQVTGSAGGFWSLNCVYTGGGAPFIGAAWNGPAFDTHLSPAGFYANTIACAQPTFNQVG